MLIFPLLHASILPAIPPGIPLHVQGLFLAPPLSRSVCSPSYTDGIYFCQFLFHALPRVLLLILFLALHRVPRRVSLHLLPSYLSLCTYCNPPALCLFSVPSILLSLTWTRSCRRRPLSGWRALLYFLR